VTYTLLCRPSLNFYVLTLLCHTPLLHSSTFHPVHASFTLLCHTPLLHSSAFHPVHASFTLLCHTPLLHSATFNPVHASFTLLYYTPQSHSSTFHPAHAINRMQPLHEARNTGISPEHAGSSLHSTLHTP